MAGDRSRYLVKAPRRTHGISEALAANHRRRRVRTKEQAGFSMTSTATVPEILHSPRRPFYFNTSAHLLRITRQKASNLSELLRAVRECSEDSIFQHTFRTLQEHHFIREGFSNDFAHWALTDCNEPGLAERLAGVDVREFTSLQDLRQRLIQLLEEYLQRNPKIAERPAQDIFYFCASDVVVMPTSFV